MVLRLEDRTLPSVSTYLPPSFFFVNQNIAAVDPNLRSQSPMDRALTYLNLHAADFGLTTADLADAIVSSQYTDGDSGTTHIYLQQSVNGLEVAGACLNISVLANGTIFTAGGGFVIGLQSRLASARPAAPVMSPVGAIRHAANELGLFVQDDPVLVGPVYGPVKSFMFNAPGVSLDAIKAQLHYVPTEDGSAVLAWELIIRTPDGQHWYDLSVAATSGELVRQVDWTNNDSYLALPLFIGTPEDGSFTVVKNPADPTASPYGWHDTNGAPGAEFTDTRGNNVDAHADRDANNVADTAPPRPDGGPSLDFSRFSFDAVPGPTALGNQHNAQLNLFYVNNMLHDIHYQYGFTEAAGNFQVNNYGNGGLEGDAVQADAQDGSGTNNANFSTPPDGMSPRMQMFLYTLTSPNRDGDLDDGTIIHEFGHGVSHRLTGGPNDSGELNALQSGGMGEGWGDFYGAMFLQRASDLPTEGFGHSTYTRDQDRYGAGNRTYRYSYDFAIDPHTFNDYGTVSTEVHYSGEIWCSALWDMNWLLNAKYGFDSNLLTGWSPSPGPGRAGNKLALKLVMDAMKLQPVNPSFIQARDAIIAADIALNGGADLFEIWFAFARRGLGEGATTASSSATSITTSFTLPMVVASVVPATDKVVTTHPTNYVVNLSSAINPATLQAADLTVNGKSADSVSYTAGSTSATFTFAIDPVTAEGAQIINISGGAFNRASDGSAVAGYSSVFYYDPTPLQIVSVTPAFGSTVTLPFDTLDVNFNQPINPASVQNNDITLNVGRVTGFSLMNGNTTVRYTLTDLVEGSVSASFATGAFLDISGNPSAASVGGSHTLDYGTYPFPTPLQSRIPSGSLIYDGNFSASVGFVGDVDNFTLSLDANQTLNVIVTPVSSLRPSITVTGPGTNISNTAAVAGDLAQVQLIPISTAGTYTFAVSGASSTTGGFTIQAVLNVGSESEANGGPTNDTPATAQSLSAAFVDLGNGTARAVVRGRSELPPSALNFEAEPNGTIGTASLATNYYAIPNNNLYQLGISGNISSSTDADYFNIGALQVGDVLTLTDSGSPSQRGTNTDPFVRLYRDGATSIVVSDDDSGPGFDALVYRYTITTADNYYVRGYRAGTSNTGTYQLGIWLENSETAPTTGGTFTSEVEPNETKGTANNASNAWRSLQYFSSASGTITAGDTDIYSYQFTGGDIITLMADSTSSLIPQAALLNATGTVLATEDGTSAVAGAGGFSPHYCYVIPTTGTYYFRVTGASGTTGSYTANISRSTTTNEPASALGKDLYAFNVATGQSATLTLTLLSAGNLDIAVVDNTGAVVATATTGATNVNQIVSNFTPVAGGTYYAQVSGPPSIDYQVMVVTGGTFDAEANNSFGTAQAIGASKTALGAISGDDDWYQFTANAGDTITLTTTTPGGGTGEFGNALDPLIELFDPTNISLGSDDNSAADGRNTLLTRTAPLTGNYRVRITGALGTSGEYTVAAKVTSTPPPKVASVVVNDGSAQRSRVTSLKVNFDQVVTLPVNAADAFQLTRQGDGSVNLSAIAANSPTTSVTITFTGGSVDFSSLADGLYTLTVFASKVSSLGGPLDGDGNGVGNDDYVLVGTTSAGPKLFRLFGDGTGDATVNSDDFSMFRGQFGLAGPSIFDFNENNQTNSDDFAEFRKRFGISLMP